MKKYIHHILTLLIMTGWLTTACSAPPTTSPGSLQIVASTSLIGDVARQVAGNLADENAGITVLIPPGSDPHTFDPRPQDIAAISQADVVLVNGLGLEEALEPALESNVSGILTSVSEGVQVLDFNAGDEHQDEPGSESASHDDEEHAAGDPHTWMDPNNVIIWAQNIAEALSQADPQNASLYQANAEAYIRELRTLDRWIVEQVDQVPLERRKLVTDHAVFGYFAARYGFEQVGLVIPSLSTNASPSAQELADLVDAIRLQGVPAVFVGETTNPVLSQQVAAESGAQVVFVYTGSLSEPGGQADGYLDFMRYNVNAIVQALK